MDSGSIATYYREQARRLAELAQRTRGVEIRLQFLQLARQYELLASRMRLWSAPDLSA